ncbi:MAG: hypothetical protein ACAH83_06095 [Alphaproteobacteria bacterium]
MVDPKNLSDEHLGRRFKKLHDLDGYACLAASIGFVGCVISGLGLGFSSVFLAFVGVVVVPIVVGQINQSLFIAPCENEQKKREAIREQQTAAWKAIAEGKSPMAPGMSGAFNPAAATVLDSDMRTMAPLRLKKRIAEFTHG